MAFCEECGHELTGNEHFCENCGAVVVHEAVVLNKNGAMDERGNIRLTVFSKLNWSSILNEHSISKNSPIGIILTRCKCLAQHLDIDESHLLNELANYIQKAERRNVCYYLLDLDDNVILPRCQTIKDNVRLLRTISSACDVKYVFILGNEEIVEVAEWENQARDCDTHVTSDLPYATLNISSPWDDLVCHWDSVLRVGRLPTSANRFNDFKAYLENVNSHFEVQNGIPSTSYGLSALVWKRESDAEYSRISRNAVYTSPDIDDHAVVKSHLDASDSPLLYFNLHGSDEDEFWYGQGSVNNYPRVVSPKVFEKHKSFFFLGVEACYGARYIGLSPDKSILKQALANKCLSFFGASKIAYGTPEPEGRCADIVVGNFLECISNNHSAGDSYIAGMKKLSSKSEMDDSDIKTIAEFSLYGDPTVRFKYAEHSSKNIHSEKFDSVRENVLLKHSFSDNRFNIAMPDVRNLTRLALATVNENIKDKIDTFTAQNVLPDFGKHPEAYRQEIYRIQDSDIMQKIYSRKKGPIYEIAKVYFSESGNIRKVVISK